jgi:predicted cation transporter
MLEISLFCLILAILVFPIIFKSVEKHLEIFLFAAGALSVTLPHFFGGSDLWTPQLVIDAFKEPLSITAVILAAGALLTIFDSAINRLILKIERILGLRLFLSLLIVALGLFSSVFTAIVCAIILAEVVDGLALNENYRTKIVILGCFSIGLGAVLTPLGEPLGVICIAKLKTSPYNAGFFFLFKTLYAYVLPGIFLMGLAGFIARPEKAGNGAEGSAPVNRGLRDLFGYALRVYVFIMALVFLGTGLKPVVDSYIIKLPDIALYWINMVSAFLDNATLAAAEISPAMTLPQLKHIIMGLLISGGMLIPGNVPNIICAKRLNIKSRQWARIGAPLGLALMVLCFAVFCLGKACMNLPHNIP